MTSAPDGDAKQSSTLRPEAEQRSAPKPDPSPTVEVDEEAVKRAATAIIAAFDAMPSIGGSVPPKVFKHEALTFARAALSAALAHPPSRQSEGEDQGASQGNLPSPSADTGVAT